MTPKDWLEFFIKLGPWAPLVLVPWLLWKLRDWNFDRLRQRLRSRSLQHVIASSAIVLTLYYGGLFYLYYNRGLPDRFEDGVIGILIAPVSSPQEQQLYQQTIRTTLREAPELDQKVAVALLERELPQDEEEAHQTALELGRRVNAAFVLRAIRVGFGGTTQHQVWLTVVDQPDLSVQGGRLDMGTLSEGDLADLEKLRLPSEVTLLARCVLAMALYRAESYRKAADHLAAILGQPESAGAPERFDLLLAYGGAQYKDGAYRAAAASYREALQLRNDGAGLNNLAVALSAAGDNGAAEPLLKRGLAIREKALGPEHPNTATSLNNLALLYDRQGRYKEAEPLYQRALGIVEKALGPAHPDTAQSLNSLGLLYDHQGRYEEAEPLYQRALAIREKALGPEHPNTAQSLNNLALLYDRQGLYEEAEPLYQRALAIREKALGPEHPNTAQSLNNLALLYDRQGLYEEAEPLYQRRPCHPGKGARARASQHRHQPQQPGAALRPPRALRGGRAALSARPRDLGKSAGARASQHRH